MHLSRLVLNPRSLTARRDLASPYQMHATLCRAFAAPDETPPRFLWRPETGRSGRLAHVLVQSEVQPDWEALAHQEGSHSYFAEQPQTKPLPLEHLQPEQTLRFRLQANPTVTRFDPEALRQRENGVTEKGKGKRRGIGSVEGQLEWLARQGERGGFAVLGAIVARSERLKVFKHAGGAPITLQSVLYEGHLKITDLEAFRAALRSGIGPAKALGFGLLSIAKG